MLFSSQIAVRFGLKITWRPQTWFYFTITVLIVCARSSEPRSHRFSSRNYHTIRTTKCHSLHTRMNTLSGTSLDQEWSFQSLSWNDVQAELVPCIHLVVLHTFCPVQSRSISSVQWDLQDWQSNRKHFYSPSLHVSVPYIRSRTSAK